MRILNLYAGIGGNRKLWGDDHEIVAVEYEPKIAEVYQDFFPKDKMVIGDAHQYLLDHYKEFDFIWSSPPCPTHSRIRKYTNGGRFKDVYPDMTLYQEIILLQYHFKGKYVVENVIPYYEPLIQPQKSGRHYFWSNFIISDKEMLTEIPNTKHRNQTINKDSYWEGKKVRKQLILNAVHPELGLHIFKEAFREHKTLFD